MVYITFPTIWIYMLIGLLKKKKIDMHVDQTWILKVSSGFVDLVNVAVEKIV